MALETVREVRERLRTSDTVDGRAEALHFGTVVEELKDAQEGARRIENMVQDLRAFGHSDSRRTRIRVIDSVDLAMRSLPTRVGSMASIDVENRGAPDIVASFGRIEQVVVNLVTSAAKATQVGSRGSIIVRIGPGAAGMARLEVAHGGTLTVESEVGKGMTFRVELPAAPADA